MILRSSESIAKPSGNVGADTKNINFVRWGISFPYLCAYPTEIRYALVYFPNVMAGYYSVLS